MGNLNPFQTRNAHKKCVKAEAKFLDSGTKN